jgi:hypothetical protein
MHKGIAVGIALTAMLTPALAAEVPSCDVFRTRFETAPRILSLRQVGPTKLSREPQESNGDALYSFDDGESATETDLTCRNGQFFSLEMVFNSFETSSRPWPHPYFDYIASGIYGFTGWPAEKVVMTATDILKTRSAHEVDYARWKENRTDLLQPFQKKQVADAKKNLPLSVQVKDRPIPDSQWFGEKPVTPPPALIKGLLPQTGVAMIGGQSGGGKSFIGIRLGVSLIPDCNQDFFIDKYRIKRRGGVLYLVLEGKPAFPLRLMAAFEAVLDKQMNFGDRYKLPFSWNTFEPNLFNEEPEKLIKLVQHDANKMRQEFGVDLVAVFLDTMGLAACYENEDKAAQVQKVVSRLNRASDETGALFVGIDHYGKDQGAGLRGSSAKRGHVETILACLVDRDKDENAKNHRLKFEKIRDGEEGRIIPYRLQKVDMGVDEDGDPVSTCIIQWEPQRPLPKRRTPQRPKTDVTLGRAINEVKLPADPDALKAAFYKFHGGSNHAANAAWHRALKAEALVLIHGKFDHSP